MSNTKIMTCNFASNLSNVAPFTLGEEYIATRDEEGKIFLKCNLGIDIQVNYNVSNTKGSWIYQSDDLGCFGFNIK